MRRELTVTARVTFGVEATIRFDGTKEEFAALSDEERVRLAFPGFAQDFDNREHPLKEGEVVFFDVSYGENDENPVELS